MARKKASDSVASEAEALAPELEDALSADTEALPDLVPPSEALAQPADQQAALVHAVAGGATVEELIARQGYRIGKLNLLTEYAKATRVTEQLAVFRLPNTAPWFLGLINVNVNLVPVFDIAQVLGLQRSPGSRGLLLILGRGEDSAAVVVDTLPERLRFTGADKVAIPAVPPLIKDCVWGAYAKEGEVWLDFDHARMFQLLAERVSAAA
jgi:chemotaxis signal transduction protein